MGGGSAPRSGGGRSQGMRSRRCRSVGAAGNRATRTCFTMAVSTRSLNAFASASEIGLSAGMGLGGALEGGACITGRARVHTSSGGASPAFRVLNDSRWQTDAPNTAWIALRAACALATSVAPLERSCSKM